VNVVQISYTVLEDVGPAGLDEVELWYTNLGTKDPRWERVGLSRAHPFFWAPFVHVGE
jgi:hypothetical protein